MVSGSFKLSFHVSKTFYGRLIGPKGSTKRRIEEETQSKIYFPRQHEESSNVTIKAKERNQVCAALRQIRSLVGAIRRKIPIHLLVVPLNFDEVQNRVLKSILEAQLPGIDDELFIYNQIALGSYVLLRILSLHPGRSNYSIRDQSQGSGHQ
ncbi:uncharacterized protein LOC108160420 isoform X2 [Drosophila miranda]|uniref:uncharacterized protein LOC108160420 isoform X2 n=1 Tax=Drosophila miranda TaxID=7229 RepID=UPI0007E75BE2|nr:uncharacterized protein LOC108160420 isoform X2 [Drosophila miranda]